MGCGGWVYIEGNAYCEENSKSDNDDITSVNIGLIPVLLEGKLNKKWIKLN